MIPMQYRRFVNQYSEMLNYLQEMPFLERYIAGKFLGAIRNELLLQHGKDPWGSEGPRRAQQLLRVMENARSTPPARIARRTKGIGRK